jgi:uncharacterized DUF497 family protein
MKYYSWDPEKNERLKRERGVSFEVATWWIENGGLMDLIEHPNKERYPSQMIYVVNIDGYVHWVPFVESDTQIFLKTIIPSRKATQKYLGGQN